jgi:hypothetical protein
LQNGTGCGKLKEYHEPISDIVAAVAGFLSGAGIMDNSE